MFELRNVTAGYGDTVVLRNVSLRVPPRSVVALLGPNGAGKTTLLRVASGLLEPRSGSVHFARTDITAEPPHRRARRGLCHVPEGRGIFRALTVEVNLRLQAKPGRENEAVEQAVAVFPRLGERLRQVAGTMSGGEQQMLALARAYVSEPQLVLLDEVSMGLAPKVVDEVFDFLRVLAERGVSLLVVEQYVSRALELADFVYLLQRGRVEFAGESDEIGEDVVAASYLGGSR
jgi:branched-chain amino acid transport system ATP-binding protein